MPEGIHAAMVEVSRAVGAIAKARNNSQQGFRFRGIDDVYNAVHDLLAKNEVYVQTRVRDYTIQLVPRSGQNSDKQPEVHAHAIFTFVFTHKDGSTTEVEMPGESRDFGDKASNKAISFAAKYAFISAFTIPTEDQEDGDRDQPATTAEGTSGTAGRTRQGGTKPGPQGADSGSKQQDSSTVGDHKKFTQETILNIAGGDKKIARAIWDTLDGNDRLPKEGEWTRSKSQRVVKEAKQVYDEMTAPIEGATNGSK